MLYQWEVGAASTARRGDRFTPLHWPRRRRPPSPTTLRAFATALVARHRRTRREAIDPLIAEHATNWRLERMAVLDRLILRMAVCELLREPATPPAVVINEALELARTFSTEEAVKFINGMLDAIRKKLRERTSRQAVRRMSSRADRHDRRTSS